MLPLSFIDADHEHGQDIPTEKKVQSLLSQCDEITLIITFSKQIRRITESLKIKMKLKVEMSNIMTTESRYNKQQ
jgi:hypothetical protein